VYTSILLFVILSNETKAAIGDVLISAHDAFNIWVNATGNVNVTDPPPVVVTVPHCSIKYPVGDVASGHFLHPDE